MQKENKRKVEIRGVWSILFFYFEQKEKEKIPKTKTFDDEKIWEHRLKRISMELDEEFDHVEWNRCVSKIWPSLCPLKTTNFVDFPIENVFSVYLATIHVFDRMKRLQQRVVVDVIRDFQLMCG